MDTVLPYLSQGVQGILLLVVVAAALFFKKELWPFIKRQSVDSREDLKQSQAAFLKALGEQNQLTRVEFDRLHDRLDREHKENIQWISKAQKKER